MVKILHTTVVQKIVYVFGAIILLLLSLFPRSVEVMSHNYLFLLDQGRDYMALRNIVVNHHITLIGSEIGGGYAGITGIFQGPMHYYFLTIPFILFRGDPYGGVVLMLLFSLTAIVLGFFVGQKIFGKPFGFLAALLFALSPPLISAARFVWNPHPSVFFMLLAFYCIYNLGSEKRNLIYVFLAGFLTSFTYNFEIAMTVPLIIALIVYVVFMQRLNKKQYAFLFVGLLLPFVPMVLFEIKHNFLAVHGFLHYISQPHDTKGYGLINNHFDSFFLNAWDTFPHFLQIPQWIFAVVLIIPTLYFAFLEKNKQLKKWIIYLFLVISTEIFVLSFLRNHIFMYYLLDLNLIYIFFFVYILFSSLKQKQFIVTGIFSLLLIALTLYGIVNAYTTTQQDLKDYGGVSKIKSHTDALDYIYKDADLKPFGLFVFTPNVFTDPFDYTILWYGQNTYHYLPTKEMNGTFYLLMQPDPYNKYSYQGWEDTVIKNGKILWTKTLPSGLIVQKRER